MPFSIQFKRRFTINNTAFGAENKKEQVNECRQYTVEDLFCCAYAPFFWQAIQIRYPEYATYNRELYALLRLFWHTWRVCQYKKLVINLQFVKFFAKINEAFNHLENVKRYYI